MLVTIWQTAGEHETAVFLIVSTEMFKSKYKRENNGRQICSLVSRFFQAISQFRILQTESLCNLRMERFMFFQKKNNPFSSFKARRFSCHRNVSPSTPFCVWMLNAVSKSHFPPHCLEEMLELLAKLDKSCPHMSASAGDCFAN